MSDTARCLIGAVVLVGALVFFWGWRATRDLPPEPEACDTCAEVDDLLAGQPSDYDGEPDSDAVIRERFNEITRNWVGNP